MKTGAPQNPSQGTQSLKLKLASSEKGANWETLISDEIRWELRSALGIKKDQKFAKNLPLCYRNLLLKYFKFGYIDKNEEA